MCVSNKDFEQLVGVADKLILGGEGMPCYIKAVL